MRWILRLVETDGEGELGCLDVMDIVRPDELGDIADLGLTLAEAKLLQARAPQERQFGRRTGGAPGLRIG